MEDVNVGTIVNIIMLLPLLIYGIYLLSKDDQDIKKQN